MNLKIRRTLEFLFFIFPSYFIIAFIVYCIFQGAKMWSEPSLVPLALIAIGNVMTGIFLVKKQYWFSIFIIICGIYLVCTGKNHAFIFEVVTMYGVYLIAHFSLCSLYVFITRKRQPHLKT